jgi:hypothetical protein
MLDAHQRTKLRACRCESITPLGVPVDPDVYRMYARSSSTTRMPGSGTFASVASAYGTVADPSEPFEDPSSTTNVTRGSCPSRAGSSVAARPAVETTALTEQSFQMVASRGTGAFGSSGTYTAPAFIVPYTAATISTHFGRWMPTRSPGATPASMSAAATPFAACSSRS